MSVSKPDEYATLDGEKFEKLYGSENFPNWKFFMQNRLAKAGRWKYVVQLPPTTTVTSVGDKEQTKDEKAKAEALSVARETWLEEDQKAMSTINLSIAKNQIGHVRNCKTAKEVWDTFSQLYENSSMVNTVQLLRQLIGKTLGKDEDMPSHLSTMSELVSRLEACQETISENIYVALILSSLTKDYDSLIMGLESRDSKDLTVDYVSQRLILEYSRKHGSDTGSKSNNGGGKAFYTKNNNGDKNNQNKNKNNNKNKKFKKNKKDMTCDYCKRKGHDEESCFIRIGVEEKLAQAKLGNAWISFADLPPAAFVTSSHPKETQWYLDSGASRMLCGFRSQLHNYEEGHEIKISIAEDGRYVKSVGKGSVKLTVTVDGKSRIQEINDVYLVPNLGTNLISISTLDKKGFETRFKNGKGKILNEEGTPLAESTLQNNGLYLLDLATDDESASFAKADNVPLNVWHHRLAHAGYESIKKMAELKIVDNLKMCDDIKQFCSDCALGKATHLPFPQKSQRKKLKPMEFIHADIWGPAPVQSKSGKHYLLVLVDDASDMGFVYPIAKKSDTFETFKEFKTQYENEHGQKIRKLKTLRTDNGGEFTSNAFSDYLKEHGIRHETCTAYTPQQNGKVERRNLYLLNSVRCMMNSSNASKSFWAEAAVAANYIQNRVSHSAIKGKTPY